MRGLAGLAVIGSQVSGPHAYVGLCIALFAFQDPPSRLLKGHDVISDGMPRQRKSKGIRALAFVEFHAAPNCQGMWLLYI
jgi:hypothetical protein